MPEVAGLPALPELPDLCSWCFGLARPSGDGRRIDQQLGPSLARSETAVSALIFRAGNEWLALPTEAIVEVAEQRTIHTLPHQTNRAILGLSNIRGSLLLCVSLTQMLGAERGPAATTQRLLVVSYQGQTLVFPVDEVLGVQRYTETELQAVPSTVAQSHTTYTQAMIISKDKKIGLLDCNLLFYALNRSLT
jgi:chemotaxis-related protein WspD